jgi:hypothetical protein
MVRISGLRSPDGIDTAGCLLRGEKQLFVRALLNQRRRHKIRVQEGQNDGAEGDCQFGADKDGCNPAIGVPSDRGRFVSISFLKTISES